MRLTTKGRYAVTAMLDLALSHGKGPTALAEIAEHQGISLSYLEQLFARLRRASLVSAVRGPGGGYRLAREPSAIFVGEVISAVDEGVDATRCGGENNCQNDLPCLTHYLWLDLSSRIRDYLGGISLQQVMDQAAMREKAHSGIDVAGPEVGRGHGEAGGAV